MATYMLLLREDDHAWDNLAAEERQRLMERYFAWVRDLRAKGHFKDGDPLARGGRLLQMSNGTVVDGPFTETKEVITGYFLLDAPDWETVVELARGCPALYHGENVVIREIADPTKE